MINADAAISSRIKQIVLFGSLLAGTPEDTVGDIDVVMTIKWRTLPAAQRLALEDQEQADAPTSIRQRESALLWWPQTRLRRRLSRISPYLSFHPDGDLLGCVHQEVYAYDLEQECEVPPNGDLRTRDALKNTVLEELPCERNCHVMVRLYHHHTSQVTIDIDVFGLQGQHARLRRLPRDYFIRQAPLGLISILEAVDRAVAAWYERMRPQFRGLGVEISFVCTPQETPRRRAGPKSIDLCPLFKPLLELLDHCWKKPRKKYEGYEQRLTATLDADPVVSYHSSNRAKPKPLKGRVRWPE